MPDLFKRVAKININGIEFSGLRIAFKVSKGLAKEPNTCEVQIYNLSEDSRKKVQQKGAQLVVVAGYEGTAAQICKMDVRHVSNVREGVDWVTKITAGDGEVAYRNITVSKSWSKNADIKKVAEEIAGAFGLDKGNVVKRLAKGGFKQGITNLLRGHSVNGLASKEMTRIMNMMGLNWSIQDGRLQVLADNETTDDPVVVLNAASGLLGSPEIGETGAENGATKRTFLKIKSLLQPELMPGRRVKLDAARLKGTTRVEKVSHVGDTHGEDWYSDIEATII